MRVALYIYIYIYWVVVVAVVAFSSNFHMPFVVFSPPRRRIDAPALEDPLFVFFPRIRRSLFAFFFSLLSLVVNHENYRKCMISVEDDLCFFFFMTDSESDIENRDANTFGYPTAVRYESMDRDRKRTDVLGPERHRGFSPVDGTNVRRPQRRYANQSPSSADSDSEENANTHIISRDQLGGRRRKELADVASSSAYLRQGVCIFLFLFCFFLFAGNLSNRSVVFSLYLLLEI